MNVWRCVKRVCEKGEGACTEKGCVCLHVCVAYVERGCVCMKGKNECV